METEKVASAVICSTGGGVGAFLVTGKAATLMSLAPVMASSVLIGTPLPPFSLASSVPPVITAPGGSRSMPKVMARPVRPSSVTFVSLGAGGAVSTVSLANGERFTS